MRLKLILRRLLQKKEIVFINLFGLAVALCTTIFLVFYIVQEHSYDKHIPNHERIFRLLSLWQEEGKTETLPINLSEYLLQLKQSIPEVEEVVQIYNGGDSYFKIDNQVIADNPTFQVDSTFFKVFNFKPVYGTLTGALNNPDDIVVSQKTSRKVFGEQNPVGESVIVDGEPFTITAVIENVPDNTHFYFDVLKPISPDLKKYESLEFYTYILLRENANRDIAISKCEQKVIEALNNRFRDFDFTAGAKLEPLADIHLKTMADFDLKENGNITLILFLSILSAIILIIAFTNYINLFMAQKEGVIKHISIQKIFGSSTRQNVALLFGESSIIIVLSFMLAFLVFYSVKSGIANYIGVDFISNLWQSPKVYFMLAMLLIVSILAAGLYPAFYISRVIKSGTVKNISSKLYKKEGRKQLLIFQFSLVSFLIIGILTIHTQIRYIENKPKGFSSENVINYKRITDKLVDKWDFVANELKSIPHVVEVTGSHSYPGSGGSGQGISYNGAPVFSIEEARVQQGYLNVFGIELVEGRFFNNSGLEKNAVVLNKTAVKELGIENPIGKYLDFNNGYTNDGKVQIIGVVNDYNYESLKQKIAPLMLTNYRNDIYSISIKTDGLDGKKVIDEANAVFKKFDPEYRIVFNYFNTELSHMYASEHALRRIFYLGTFLGILVALIGLMSFAALMIGLRTKEIGIRKVNGAKVSEILTMLNKDFIQWVAIAFIIATPIAYYVMSKWLENFAYKTELSWWIFALAGVLALGIALLTVSFQSWKAAIKNPVESLRYE